MQIPDILGLSVKVIQEQDKKIKNFETENQNLNARLDLIEQRLGIPRVAVETPRMFLELGFIRRHLFQKKPTDTV